MAEATLTPVPTGEVTGDPSLDPTQFQTPVPGLPVPVEPGLPQPVSLDSILTTLTGRAQALPTPQEAMTAGQQARSSRERTTGMLATELAGLEESQKALERDLAARGATIAALPVPQPPVLPPAPSRGLRAFLAAGPDESPEASIQKLMAGIMTLATSMGGLVRGDGTAALAAISGAMQGWAEGDKQRADRACADWQASTDRMLKNYDLERTAYKDTIEAGNLPLEMRKAALALNATRFDNRKALLTFMHEGEEKWAGFVKDMSKE